MKASAPSAQAILSCSNVPAVFALEEDNRLASLSDSVRITLEEMLKQ